MNFFNSHHTTAVLAEISLIGPLPTEKDVLSYKTATHFSVRYKRSVYISVEIDRATRTVHFLGVSNPFFLVGELGTFSVSLFGYIMMLLTLDTYELCNSFFFFLC